LSYSCVKKSINRSNGLKGCRIFCAINSIYSGGHMWLTVRGASIDWRCRPSCVCAAIMVFLVKARLHRYLATSMSLPSGSRMQMDSIWAVVPVLVIGLSSMVTPQDLMCSIKRCQGSIDRSAWRRRSPGPNAPSNRSTCHRRTWLFAPRWAPSKPTSVFLEEKTLSNA